MAIICSIVLSRRDPALEARGNWFRQQPGCIWQNEDENSAENTARLLITRQGVSLQYLEERFSFHPSMALLRIINIRRGFPDRYLEATDLKPGGSLLDLTLGLATDALVGATILGPSGSLRGIESSPLLAALIQDGLTHLANDPLPKVKKEEKLIAWQELSSAARLIDVQWHDHLSFLYGQPSRSVDVIYLDPMFRSTCVQSASIRPMHIFADQRALSLETIGEACRVARKRVVLKERKGSGEFTRLGFNIMPGGRYSQVDYGIILV